MPRFICQNSGAVEQRKAGVAVRETDHADEAAVQRDIAASMRGDGDAFARIVTRYESQVARQMWRFSRDPRISEELVQDVFVEAYYSLSSYRAKATFIAWLRVIATRVGYRYWKDQARNKKRREQLVMQTPEPITLPKEADALEATEAADWLHHLLARLPGRDRLVLTLMYFEECSVAEIATRTEWSTTRVKVQAFRARKKLRALIEAAGGLEIP